MKGLVFVTCKKLMIFFRFPFASFLLHVRLKWTISYTFLFCQFCILAKCKQGSRTILNFRAYNPKVSENVSFNTRIINYYDFMLKMKKFKIGQNTNCRAVVLFYPGIRSQKLSGLEAGQGRIRLFWRGHITEVAVTSQ